MTRDNQLEVGRIDKAHGVIGEVVVSLTADRVERVAPGAWFDHTDGRFTVERSRPHQHRFIVKFAEITNRDQADQARGTVLYGDPIDDADVLWVHDLVGCVVVDPDGSELGRVASVEANPASDLLVLGDESLVPLTFFVGYDTEGRVVVDPPDGLFDPA